MEETTIKGAIEVLKQVGFPIFVASWFMLRTDKRLEALTRAVNRIEPPQEDDGK